MNTVTSRAPTIAGMRSSETPSLAARARPAAATRARATAEATIVPTIAQAASVLSAPNRRYQRNPYAAETAFPPGKELAMAWAARVILNSAPRGGVSPPPCRSLYCMPVKATKDIASAATAAGIHHQSSFLKTSGSPESSSVWAARIHTATASTASAISMRSNGQ